MLAPLIFLSGVGGGTFVLIRQMITLPDDDTFSAPASRTLRINEPGKYVLWHDYKVMFNGRMYNKPEALPDQTVISLTRDGREIPGNPSLSSCVTSGQNEKRSVMRYQLDEAGEYMFSITGLDEERIFSFGPSRIKDILFAIALCLVLNLFGWIGAPAVVVIVLVKRAGGSKTGKTMRKPQS